jgi:hypothetical protein
VTAPCTYVRLALGAAPDGRIRFRSLVFADVHGLAPIDGLIPGQALCFGDLDFVADHLGQLQLSEENVALPHILMLDHSLARAGPAIIDSDVLACIIDTCLWVNPEPELSRRVFYVLANTFAQLSRSGPLPPEAEFWNPNTTLPSKMRDVIALFERELARSNGHTMTPASSGFVGMMEWDPSLSTISCWQPLRIRTLSPILKGAIFR